LGRTLYVILSPNPENYIIDLHYHENLKYCIFLIYLFIYLSVCGLFNNVLGGTDNIAWPYSEQWITRIEGMWIEVVMA